MARQVGQARDCADERHADPDLVAPLTDGVRQHAVDTDGGEQEGDGRESNEEYQ